MTRQPQSVALLAYPERSSSVVVGMHDLFMSAGCDRSDRRSTQNG